MNLLKYAKLLLFITTFFSITVWASPPTHDNFLNAETISGTSGIRNTATTEATRESGEPIHALNRGGRSVWYKYVAPGNGVLTVSTAGSGFNTLLSVYVGATLANLKPVAAMDDYAITVTYGVVTIATQLNTTYYIAVDGHNDEGAGAASGDLRLTWQFQNASLSDSFLTPHTLLTYRRGQRVESNVGASKEVGEPDHADNAGGKSIWFLWTAPTDAARSYTFSTKGSARPTGNGALSTLLAVYTGTSVSALTPIVSSSSYGAKVTFTPVPGTTYRIAADGYDSGQGADTGTINLTWGPTDSTKDLDFDEDGKTDITVFRPTNGVWYTRDSITGFLRAVPWGANGDKPVPGKFDSDDRLDYNVFRPDTATWWTLGSTFGPSTFRWGTATDIPFNFRTFYADYTGVFRPSDGTWHIYIGSGYSVQFGQNGDVPVNADYDGDGHDNIVIFRPSTGTWWFLNQLTGAQTPVQFGLNGDKPVPADYDGDGLADLAVFRPSEGAWYIRRSSDNSVQVQPWGLFHDKPQPGDYDGDKQADIAVYRPGNGTWYILRSSDGEPRFIAFGLSGDDPVAFGGD